MDEEQRQARKAAVAEMMLALRVALETLDQLEARTAGEEKLGPASPASERNPVARHIAVAMTKARSGTDKA
jgi:hypothetical protein